MTGVSALEPSAWHSATIAPNITQLSYSGERIEIIVGNTPQEIQDAVLALFVPEDAYEAGRYPLKFTALNTISTQPDGTRVVRWSLLNLRQSMRISLLQRTSNGAFHTLVRGPTISVVNPDEPTGVHLLAGRSPRSVLVQWTTFNPGSPQVWFGTSPDRLQWSAPASSDTYTPATLCGGRASNEGWLEPGYLHTADMLNLPKATDIFYQVGDAVTGVKSRVYSFFSHPGVGPDKSASVLLVADQGASAGDDGHAPIDVPSARVVAGRMATDALAGFDVAERWGPEELARTTTGCSGSGCPRSGELPGSRLYHPYSLVIHNGDVSYAQGVGVQWDQFFEQQGAACTGMPMLASVGNHEDSWGRSPLYRAGDSGGECGVPYRRRLDPTWASAGEGERPRYRSVEWGPMRLIVLDTERSTLADSAQRLWLRAELAEVDRSRTPWLAVVMHRPMYVNTRDNAFPQGKLTTAVALQTALEDLMLEARVDLVLAGHQHSYERTCAVARGRCVKQGEHGIVHLGFGNGGAGLYNNPAKVVPAWSAAYFGTTHGHVRMHVNATTLALEAVASKNFSVFDRVSLSRAAGDPRAEQERLRCKEFAFPGDGPAKRRHTWS